MEKHPASCDNKLTNRIDDISGVILAGGRGSRLSGDDKGLIEVAGEPMINLIIERFLPQVSNVVINANRNIATYERYGFPVIEDSHVDFAGPLAGMSAALNTCSTSHLATVPCDTPFLPSDVVSRLATALVDTESQIAIARGGDRPQPAFTLLSVNLAQSLCNFLRDGGRKISTWYKTQNYVEVDFGPDATPFANVNTPQDLINATAILNANREIKATP